MFSAPKLMVVLTVLFFLVGLPTMAAVAISYRNSRRRRGRGDRIENGQR